MSKDIPYIAIKQLVRVNDDADLAKIAGINYSTLKKAMSGERPASSFTHMALLNLVSRNFQQSSDLDSWLEEVKWPKHLLTRDAKEIGGLHEELNATTNLFIAGQLPLHYISRPEWENKILEPLMQTGGNALNGVVVNGLDGIGKSTLVLAALTAHRRKFVERFGSRIHRLDVRGASFEQVLVGQLAKQMNLTSVGQIELALRRKAHLLFLDDLDRLEELPHWVRLGGILNKIIVTTPLRPNPRELSSLALAGIPMPTLNQTEAQALVEKLSGQPIKAEEQSIFTDLFESLGGFPLVLELLAIYRSETHLPWAVLKERLWTYNPLVILDSIPDIFTKVQLCLDMATERIFTTEPLVGCCFRTLGIFGRSSGFDNWLGIATGMDAQTLEHCLTRLMRLNIIQLFPTQNSTRIWRMHPFVRDAAELALRAQPDEFQQVASRYLDLMSALASEAGQLAYGKSPDSLIATLPAGEIMHSWRLGMESGRIGQVLLSVNNYLGILIAFGQIDYPRFVLKTLDEWLTSSDDVDRRIFAHLWELQGRVELADINFLQAQELFHKALELNSDPAFQAGLRINLGYCALFLEQVEQAVVQAGLAWQMILSLAPEIQARLWLDYEALRLTILARGKTKINELPALANENVEVTNYLSLVNVLVAQADYWNSIGEFAQALLTLEQLDPWLHSSEWPLLRAQVWEEVACAQIGLEQHELALQSLDAEVECLNDYPNESVLWAKLWQWRALCTAELGRKTEACTHLQKSLELWERVPDSEANQRNVSKMMADLCG